jgi:hypothetical protein
LILTKKLTQINHKYRSLRIGDSKRNRRNLTTVMWTAGIWTSLIVKKCKKVPISTIVATIAQDARALQMRTRHRSAKPRSKKSVFTCAPCVGPTTMQEVLGSQISTFTNRLADYATFRTGVTRVVQSTAKSTGPWTWQTKRREPRQSEISSGLTRLGLCWLKIGRQSRMSSAEQAGANGRLLTS